ncbi:hypothetical protein G9A89_006483 [Geosiphon pyriformis]|nr:hypothetical protein G9A89_006483 [Geosiphon pyriformis]
MPTIFGSLNHLCLTVSDYDKSIELYDLFLTRLGYKQGLSTPNYTLWSHPKVGSIGINPVKPEYKDIKHNRYTAGFHHLAFNASSRKDVDEFYDFLVENEYEILDEPAEYPYSPGYYAVFWTDLDGMKFELAYIPPPPTIKNKEQEIEGKDHEGNGITDEKTSKRQKTE